ncbi:MAG: amino acid permease [Erysipelotrichaceae bacterium]|nr:amino acid permease [Erysipelotrichaceae bacterium]
MSETSNTNKQTELKPYLSPIAVWALSVGSAIGWGSLIVTSKTYLSQAGPLGSIIGLLIGFAMMLMVSSHYHFLGNRYPGVGGLYNYVKEVFGYDFAFLIGWFMFLIYIALFWGNATSIPLFARYFVSDAFKTGYLFSVFGYEVYLGEALLTLFVMWMIGLLCMKSKKATANAMVVMALIFTIGITICFVIAMIGHQSSGMSMSPAFVPDSSALRQVIRIGFLSPWAFIGFESVSHSAEEYKFKHSSLFRILFISVAVTTALYIFIILLSVTAYPEGCTSWLDYISRLDEFEGINGLPAFYAAYHYLGDTGVYILMASLLSLVLTSLISMLRTVSRLCYAVAKDGILPKRYAELSDKQIPVNAITLVLLLSLPIPFLGRTTTSWIVDVTTIGATIIYGFASIAVFKVSGKEGAKINHFISGICLFILVAFLVFLLFPGVFSDYTIETETYVLMAFWSILGLIYFNFVIRKDHDRKYGNSILVWISLLIFVVLNALTWSERLNEEKENKVMAELASYFDGTADSETLAIDKDEYIAMQLNRLHDADNVSALIVGGLFGVSLMVMLINYNTSKKWENEAASERDQARTIALTDPMTGVKSKHAFLLNQKKLNASIEEGVADKFAVVVCDVNGLKVINDTLGHKAGDEYIINACRMICDIFQHSPVYRTGGDEFVVIMTGRDYLIRKELVMALHDRSVEHINTKDVVISGGLSDYEPGVDTSFHAVFERADKLMYEEKKLLKAMGAISREDAETEGKQLFANDEDAEIMYLKRHVLIVEDERINQMILGEILGEDYDILYASDGIEALEQVKTHKDELAMVLLDLMMPQMSGMEVLKVMKEEEELRNIPVIVMTADQASEVDCLKIGAIDFIPKPYPSAEIIQARVAKCIELTEKRNIIQSTERDSLTNLLNFEYFMRYVRMYDQHYNDMPMDAIILDVNHFHMLNERYGKQYGDSVLARIGRQVRQISREVGGVACRHGADIFLIYCPHREDYESILDKASEELVDEDVSVNRVRLRMGVYSEVDKSIQIERRFDYAKIAADKVKTGFKKPIGLYDTEMYEAELYRERLLEDFKPSLENGRFLVYFQPKYDIRPESPILASAEALVRWDHPELGMISPAVFIPLLEDNGLILDLDQFVWHEAAKRIREWKDRFGFSVPVSVNVSRIDMLTPDLKGIFMNILEEFSLDPKDLVLEITESAYTGDNEQVISTAKELRGMGMGFRIEMDDFGTGYSSLGMLSHLPIDALKLDMSFIRNAFGETRDIRMIELIIDIADYLHVPVVAEGVETEEQYMVLKAMGCDYVQGYYFSKPVPHDAFDKLLIERGKIEDDITPAVKKSYMSISKALTSDFESIYYVDVASDFYLEFFISKDGDLQIRPAGTNFFEEAREQLLKNVNEEDAQRIREATSKTNLIRLAEQEEELNLYFQKEENGESRTYSLQVIRNRESDHHHIVIGVRQELNKPQQDL